MKRLLSSVRWYVRELFGETAYENYLAHHRTHHHATPPLSRRQFDRLKTDPKVRCC